MCFAERRSPPSPLNRALHLTLAEDDECKESLRGSGAVTLLASLIGLLAREPATLLPPPLQPAPASGSISRNVSTTLATSQLPQPPTRGRSHTSLAGTSSSQGGARVSSNGLDNAETALAGHARRHEDLHSAPFDSVVVSDTPVVTPWTRLLAVALLQAAARLAPASDAAAAVGAATPVKQEQADQPATKVVDATEEGSRWEAKQREHEAVNGQQSVSDPEEGAEGNAGETAAADNDVPGCSSPGLLDGLCLASPSPPKAARNGGNDSASTSTQTAANRFPATAADDGDSDVSFVEEEGSEYCPPSVGMNIDTPDVNSLSAPPPAGSVLSAAAVLSYSLLLPLLLPAPAHEEIQHGGRMLQPWACRLHLCVLRESVAMLKTLLCDSSSNQEAAVQGGLVETLVMVRRAMKIVMCMNSHGRLPLCQPAPVSLPFSVSATVLRWHHNLT